MASCGDPVLAIVLVVIAYGGLVAVGLAAIGYLYKSLQVQEKAIELAEKEEEVDKE